VLNVGRQKHGSLIFQLTQHLKSLQRFGQSKHSAKADYRRQQEAKGKKWNPAFASGIFSFNTYNAYKQTAVEFAGWLKESHPGIKIMNQITKEHAIQYLQMRQTDGKSAYTTSKDMSALNKAFNFNLNKREAGLNNRSYKNVARSRAVRPHDKKFNPRNYTNQITFAKAFGCRRESILGGQYQVKLCSLWRDPKGNIFVSLIEKGGKFRNAPVLQAYKKDIEKMVPHMTVRTQYNSLAMEAFHFKELYRTSGQECLFSRYTEKIDNHAFRAQYARDRYEELVRQKREQGEEVLNNYRGFDCDCLRQVSLDLGHSRINVVVEHYMR
jgi:hypothetical protein